MTRQLRGYQQVIFEGTGRDDPVELALIEDCMRHTIFHSTLDWQTREQLHRGARDAVEVLKATGKLR